MPGVPLRAERPPLFQVEKGFRPGVAGVEVSDEPAATLLCNGSALGYPLRRDVH